LRLGCRPHEYIALDCVGVPEQEACLVLKSEVCIADLGLTEDKSSLLVGNEGVRGRVGRHIVAALTIVEHVQVARQRL
jgi:hypothetical protein